MTQTEIKNSRKKQYSDMLEFRRRRVISKGNYKTRDWVTIKFDRPVYYAGDILKWVKHNSKGRFYLDTTLIMFEDEQSAIMFKLSRNES